ncbi:hypothetical protein ACFFLS_12540 [Flavobacterium procerum]|uniref:Uncharacterized protein n=1 Tax=Flavobacterium procerum TaxID=1455569 RepID=A0ABV6BR07_9FLAO
MKNLKLIKIFLQRWQSVQTVSLKEQVAAMNWQWHFFTALAISTNSFAQRTGGGDELAMAFDLRYASKESAVF